MRLTRIICDMAVPLQDEYTNEIAVMKELVHPHVVKLYEVIHDPEHNKLLMIMEYVEGGCVLAGDSLTQKVGEGVCGGIMDHEVGTDQRGNGWVLPH